MDSTIISRQNCNHKFTIRAKKIYQGANKLFLFVQPLNCTVSLLKLS